MGRLACSLRLRLSAWDDGEAQALHPNQDRCKFCDRISHITIGRTGHQVPLYEFDATLTTELKEWDCRSLVVRLHVNLFRRSVQVLESTACPGRLTRINRVKSSAGEYYLSGSPGLCVR